MKQPSRLKSKKTKSLHMVCNSSRSRDESVEQKENLVELVTRKTIQKEMLSWYRRQHRDLPWRQTADPYSIWVSEVMLQQTRVDTVKEYYCRFLEVFPNPTALASAELEEVLALWAGLGYYSRARHLHRAACEMVTKYGGQFPKHPDEIRALPGVGAYTAGAILSIAYGQSVPLVDGNVIRVLGRLFALSDSLESSATQRKYWSLASSLIPLQGRTKEKNDPGDFNQALMELGATICTPQNPSCFLCPVRSVCRAYETSSPDSYPPKKQRKKPILVSNVALVIRKGQEVLMAKRAEIGLWGGLFEFPQEISDGSDAVQQLVRSVQLQFGVDISAYCHEIRYACSIEQQLTHRSMTFKVFEYVWNEHKDGLFPPTQMLHWPGCVELRWVDWTRTRVLGIPVWVQKVMTHVGIGQK